MPKFSYLGNIAGLIFLLISCGRSTSENNTDIPDLLEIDYSRVKANPAISELIDTLEFIPLIGSIENPISRIDELQIKNDRFFILDKRRKEINVYNLDGSPCYKVANTGRAENEYLEIACFAVTDSSLLIADNYQSKINEYDAADGKYLRTHRATVVVGGIRPLQNGGFILAELPVEGVNITDASDGNRIYIVDRDFAVKDSYYPFGNTRDKYAMPSYFTGNDSTYVYASADFPGYTVIDASTGRRKGNVRIKTDNPLDQEAIADVPLENAGDYIFENDLSILTSTPRICGNYILFNIKKGNDSPYSIYDAKSGNIYSNDPENYHNLLIAPHEAYDDSFFTVYNFGGNFLDQQLAMGFTPPSNVADSIIRNNGAVVLRYRMKP